MVSAWSNREMDRQQTSTIPCHSIFFNLSLLEIASSLFPTYANSCFLLAWRGPAQVHPPWGAFTDHCFHWDQPSNIHLCEERYMTLHTLPCQLRSQLVGHEMCRKRWYVIIIKDCFWNLSYHINSLLGDWKSYSPW